MNTIGSMERLIYYFSKLPGVGRKTASVFLNTLTGGNYIAVDTHVQRLAKRLGFSKGNTPFEIEQDSHCEYYHQ